MPLRAAVNGKWKVLPSWAFQMWPRGMVTMGHIAVIATEQNPGNNVTLDGGSRLHLHLPEYIRLILDHSSNIFISFAMFLVFI